MALKKKKVKNKKKVIRKRLPKKKKPAKKKEAKRKPLKKRKILKRKPAKKIKPKKREGAEVGIISHYFPHVQAAVIKLKCPLSVGENINIKGHTTDFTQPVVSMQINRVTVTSAKSGQEIGILVNSRVRQGDLVTKC
ncbi:MAG: hypothetical protein WAQ07_05640 [Candidatus Omnitrophota bacterium]